jgi:hypothetical protein
LIRGLGYSLPTRFKKASAVGSPQYPAAISAGIRRGQEPVGIMAGRGMQSIRRMRCGVTDKRLAWISFCVAHVHHSRRKWKGTIPPVVEQDAAEYGSEEMAYGSQGFS